MKEDTGNRRISDALRVAAGRAAPEETRPYVRADTRAPANEFEELAAKHGAVSVRGVGALLRDGESIRDLLKTDPEMFARGSSGDGGKGNDTKPELPSINTLFHRYVKGY